MATCRTTGTLKLAKNPSLTTPASITLRSPGLATVTLPLEAPTTFVVPLP